MGYALVTQLFPALLASLAPRQFVTKQGAAAGIVVGVTTVAVVTLSDVTVGSLLPGLPQAVKGLNFGVPLGPEPHTEAPAQGRTRYSAVSSRSCYAGSMRETVPPMASTYSSPLPPCTNEMTSPPLTPRSFTPVTLPFSMTRERTVPSQ